VATEHPTATVRFRITAVAALAVAVVLAGTGVALVVTQRRVLTENLDETLGSRADAIAAELAAGGRPDRAPLADVADDDGIAQVVGPGGEVVAASRAAAGDRPVAEAPARDRAVRTVARVTSDADGPYRVVSVRVTAPGGPFVVHVAAPTDDIRDSTALLTRSLAVALPAATLLLAVVVWWLVGRTLRPVEAIRREVAAIGATGLDRRVPVPAGDDEVARLARTMNAMLDRIEDGAARQQRFVADASHELRSPLARIRSEIEVDLAHPATADPAATGRSVLDETVGMQRLVDDLLVLARADAGAGPGAPGRAAVPVDLDDVVSRHVRRVRADGRVAVDGRGVGAAQVVGDREALGRAVGNLLDNAVRHAASTVTVTVGEEGDEAVVAVADDGPGIAPERREEVFERFTRLDGARAAGGGAGLGLAIAREIVAGHGGTLVVDPDHHPGARLVIRLPAAPGAASPPTR
jgi:signal transduction histidine kinase